MTEIKELTEINNNELPVRKTIGRPMKYENGYVYHRYKKITVPRDRYSELLDIEKKYDELLEVLKNLGTKNI